MSGDRVLVRGWGRLGWAGLGAACAFTLVAPDVAAGPAGWVPLAASLVVFGMAHGAVDHHVARRLGRRQRMAAFCAAYTAGAATIGALWFVAPTFALILFLAVSTFHWGQGEVWFAGATGRPAFGARWRLVAFVAARGSLPVLLPVLAHPRAADAALTALRDVLASGGGAVVPSGTVAAAGVVVITAVTLAAAAGALADRAPLRDIGELAGLAAAVCLLPPVLAVGTYFLCWHAPRHAVRLMVGDPAQCALLRAGRPLRATVAFHREAAPLCAVALAGCLGLAVVAGAGGVDGAVTATLAIVAGLTWPHAVVVHRMDAAQGIAR
jgi:Brp/Blh family beta-carotene 15,15'-monooxygenase